MQVDPVKPTLKAPGTKRLKLKYDEPLSNFAFKFNVRRYAEVGLGVGLRVSGKAAAFMQKVGRGLHWSTFRHNVSAFCGIDGAFRGCLGGI